MALQVPALDDRRFADLLLEARGLISTWAPEWTNHNPSDPGITLVELFAYLAEMLIYRLDRITPAHIAVFLNLLDGGSRRASDLEGTDIAAEIRATVVALRTVDRAVSTGDFESLALAADPRVERARCVPRRNLEVDLEEERPGHVSVIILPTAAATAQVTELTAAVEAYLEPRVLLTTHAHAVGPFHLDVSVSATVVPVADQTVAQVKQRVVESLSRFLDPHLGGEDGRGWPFGRNVFVSELYALLDRLPEVDYVKAGLSLSSNPGGRLVPGPGGAVVGLDVRPHELVHPQIVEADIHVEPA
jgi:hypothetical protein